MKGAGTTGRTFTSAAEAGPIIDLDRRHKCPFDALAALSRSGQALLHPVERSSEAGAAVQFDLP